MTAEVYEGTLPLGWSGGQASIKWWRGKIMHLYTLYRACAECGAEMRIDVSKAALEGTAKNAGLHLKRCTTCRAKTRALGATSRPRVEGEVIPKHAFSAAPATDAETMRTANATMKEELAALYKTVGELRERLSKYELAPAMAAVANGRMPWEH